LTVFLDRINVLNLVTGFLLQQHKRLFMSLTLRLSIHLNTAGRIRHATGIASLTEKEVDFLIATGVSTSVRLSAVLSAFG